MNKEKDFFKTCFETVAGLEVKNESQAIAKEVVLSEIENLQQENKKLNGTIQTYDILLKANVEENKQLKTQIEEYQKALDETMSEKMDIENNWNKLKEYCKSKIKEQKELPDYSKYYVENYDKAINLTESTHSGVMLETIKSTTIKRYEDILEILGDKKV